MDNSTLEKEITVRDVIINLVKWTRFLLSKWLFILIFTIVGLALGFLISIAFPEKYVSEINFVIEEGVPSSSSGSIGTALGIGGESSAGGLFSSTNNIMWLYSSNKLIEKTLLTKAEYPDGSYKLLIDDFINTSKEMEKYLKKRPDLQGLTFSADQEEFDNKQAQLLKKSISVLIKEYLSVNQVEQTDNIVKVNVKSEDEAFAFVFSTLLVELVNEFYVNTKIENSLENINKLTIKADSLKHRLDKSMVVTAYAQDNVPYANPNKTVLKVEPQQNKVEIQANTTLYLQVVQSLENAKNELAKQKPIIKIVDSPFLPLSKDKKNPILFMVVGAILVAIIAIVFLILKKIYKDPDFA